VKVSGCIRPYLTPVDSPLGSLEVTHYHGENSTFQCTHPRLWASRNSSSPAPTLGQSVCLVERSHIAGCCPSTVPSADEDIHLIQHAPTSWIARGLETDETRGMLKAATDPETNMIVSFSAIAVEGGEIMSVVQMAMMGGLT
jgi:hypothetical protein